jgi:hypothetical protein
MGFFEQLPVVTCVSAEQVVFFVGCLCQENVILSGSVKCVNDGINESASICGQCLTVSASIKFKSKLLHLFQTMLH